MNKGYICYFVFVLFPLFHFMLFYFSLWIIFRTTKIWIKYVSWERKKTLCKKVLIILVETVDVSDSFRYHEDKYNKLYSTLVLKTIQHFTSTRNLTERIREDNWGNALSARIELFLLRSEEILFNNHFLYLGQWLSFYYSFLFLFYLTFII